jgi:hypothetical protein
VSVALSAKLLGAKLRLSGAGFFGFFAGTVVVEPEARGVIAKVRVDTAPAGSVPPVWSRQHVQGVPVPLKKPLFRLVYEGAEPGVPPKMFNEKPLLAGNATTTSTFMFETRGIVTTHCVALEATHVTFNEPWAEAVASNEDAQRAVLRSTITVNREEIACHLIGASYVATVAINRGVSTKDSGRTETELVRLLQSELLTTIY